MTDNEIINALECCKAGRCISGKCAFYSESKSDEECMDELVNHSFDLINRQKAEIESLNKQLVFEIESAYDRGTKAAIRGFAENLKLKADKECVRELASYGNYWGRSMIIPKDSEVYVASYKISEADLDELVKEMTEGSK